MDSFFADLKRAREAKRISLTDISDATLINIRFLEAIEEGKIDVLPQTYVRAFIREYATVVGLDPTGIMRRYDESQEKNNAVRESPRPHPTTEPSPSSVPKEEKQAREFSVRPATARRAGIFIALFVVAVALWNMIRTPGTPPTTEIPFQSVIKESEVAGDTSGTTRKQQTVATAKGSADSLTLRAATSDTVWVQIVTDNSIPREYLLKPNMRISWKAQERFVLSLGNIGAIELTLNNKPVRIPARKSGVIQGLTLTRDSLSVRQ
jgi:cytoskeletal protein RodZ